MADFRTLADAGAVVVQGDQAHQARTLEFYNDTFIHYGLGNFFFDQMWSDGTRQGSSAASPSVGDTAGDVDLRTAILDARRRGDDGRGPDPAGDRADFLQMIFDLSPQR